MPLLTLLVVVAAAAPLKVAAPGWKITGIEQEKADAYEQRFLALLSERGRFEVITQSDLAAVLGLERQKQLMGCDTDGTECALELSNAMGAQAILSGILAKTETSFVATLRGVNVVTGQTFATASARLPNEDALFVWLEGEAGKFAERMRASFDTWVETRSSVHYTYRAWPWVAVAGGLAAAATGATLFGLSRVDLATIQQSPPPPGDPQLAAAQLKQDSGVGLGIAGVAIAAAGVGLLFWTREASASVALVPSPGGGWLTVGGRW